MVFDFIGYIHNKPYNSKPGGILLLLLIQLQWKWKKKKKIPNLESLLTAYPWKSQVPRNF